MFTFGVLGGGGETLTGRKYPWLWKVPLQDYCRCGGNINGKWDSLELERRKDSEDQETGALQKATV